MPKIDDTPARPAPWKIPIAIKLTLADHCARAAIERTWAGWEANFIIEGREDGYWRLPFSRRSKHAAMHRNQPTGSL